MTLASRRALKTTLPVLIALCAIPFLTACGKERKVHFANLQSGMEVESPFKVEMRAENLVVEPASMGVADGHGHFHIIIDAPVPEAPMPVGMDAQHIHYGKGQTEAMLDLPVGDHILTLQFAHGDHVPYSPQISEEVRIHVSKQNTPAPVDSVPANPDTAPATPAP